MKINILLIALMGFTQLNFAQIPVIEDVIKVTCEGFNDAKIPVEEMTVEEVEQIFIESRQDYLEVWDSTQRAFTQQALLPFKYDDYFIRRLETECSAFRPAIKRFYDDFLIDDEEKRKLYLKARDFIYAVEDGATDDDLNTYLDTKAPITDDFLAILRQEIEEQKATSTLKFTRLDDYIFRCEYLDYVTAEKNFRVDILFIDGTDILINNIRMTTKFALKQGYDSVDINHDIDADLPFIEQGN
jgi:hypothetical protein